MRFKVSTVDHSTRKMQEKVMFGTLLWVRTNDRAEKSVPGPPWHCWGFYLWRKWNLSGLWTIPCISFYWYCKKNKLAQKTQKSLKKVYNSSDQLPRQRKNPCPEKHFLPWNRITSWGLPTCQKEAKYLKGLNLIPPISAPIPTASWDVNTSLWRAVKTIQLTVFSCTDIITGNRIMAKPMKN